MKVLCLTVVSDYCSEYYLFPQGMTSAAQFVEYAQEHYNSFILLTMLNDDNCKYPYFIEEDTRQKYVNISQISCVREDDVKILPKDEYIKRLQKVVKEKCVDCDYYEENGSPDGDNLDGHWNMINLVGKCGMFSKIDRTKKQ